MPLNAGQMLQHRYRIVTLLGAGGMGAVYRAWDTRLDVPVAIKEFVPQPGLDAATLGRLRAQFIQEAKVLAQLDHPHLVNVSDYFEEGGSAYLVMKYVEGESLADCIDREGALEEAQVVIWGGQLLSALAYCHQRGVLHRDVKPQNVVITPEGTAVLVDFGLVKLWDPAHPRTRTAIQGMGTPEYAPPEQYSPGLGHTEPRSDVYSLGATLYHALTGVAPPSATDRMAYPQSYQPPRVHNRSLSVRVNDAIERAMALACDDRWSNAVAMASALRDEQSARAMAAVGSSSGSLSGWVWGLGAVVGLVLLGIGVGIGMGRQREAMGPPTQTPGVIHTREATATAMVVADPVTPTPRPTSTSAVAPEFTATPASTWTPTPLPLRDVPPANASLGDTWTRPADGAEMVYVPAGEFLMGSTDTQIQDAVDQCVDDGFDREDCERWYDEESPQRTVTVDAFWIDKYEVTNAQYAAFLNAEGNQEAGGVTWLEADSDSVRIHERGGVWEADSGYADHPVVEVSWYGARAYAAWVGARLPTEAEWEKAARGTEGQRYPWGNEAPTRDVCNFGDNVGETTPVGTYSPGGDSPYGCADMAGNVWEWVHDGYDEDYYEVSPDSNPQGPASGASRVLRGGAFVNDSRRVRCASRRRGSPYLRLRYYGVRLAVSPSL